MLRPSRYTNVAALFAAGEPAPPAGIGTPTSLGSLSDATGSNTRQLSGKTAPAGALLFVLLADHGGSDIGGSAVSDGAGNTYTATTQFIDSGGSIKARAFYCLNATALSSTTITGTFTTADPTGKTIHAAYVTGIATASALDVEVVTNAGATANPSVSTGTLAQAAEVIFGMLIMGNAASDTLTEDTPEFNNLSKTQPVELVNLAAKVVSATTSITYNPTNNNSRHQACKVISFKGA